MSFEEILDNVKNTFSFSKKRLLFISCLLILMTLSAIVILVEGRKTKPSERKISEQRKINAEKTLLIPQGPEVPEGYEIGRKTKDKWQESEIQEWFTVPDEAEIEKLSDSNDKIVDEILGAAP